MKKINKLALTGAKIMTATDMKHITGGSMTCCVVWWENGRIIGSVCGPCPYPTAADCERDLKAVYPDAEIVC